MTLHVPDNKKSLQELIFEVFLKTKEPPMETGPRLQKSLQLNLLKLLWSCSISHQQLTDTERMLELCQNLTYTNGSQFGESPEG